MTNGYSIPSLNVYMVDAYVMHRRDVRIIKVNFNDSMRDDKGGAGFIIHGLDVRLLVAGLSYF